jgi:hypothetical protein
MDVGLESSLDARSTAQGCYSTALNNMRTLCELFVIAALVWLTWDQSIKDRLGDLTGRKVASPPPAPPPAVRYVTKPTPTPSGDWMWDPARRSSLDRPAYEGREGSQRYLDAQGRKYWIDAKGVRHYDQ